jgi:hypothetical protein
MEIETEGATAGSRTEVIVRTQICWFIYAIGCYHLQSYFWKHYFRGCKRLTVAIAFVGYQN